MIIIIIILINIDDLSLHQGWTLKKKDKIIILKKTESVVQRTINMV